MTNADIKVSIGEICEVREGGLQASELLALAASAAEVLPSCPRGQVFDPDRVLISSDGSVVIKTVHSSSVNNIFHPPEWSRGENDEGAAAVYCMGAVMRECAAEEAQDVDLSSLVNILTVGMVGTRPTAHRMGQMARNQLKGQDPKSILLALYEEIMGDEEGNELPDDMDYDDLDEFDDEVPELKNRISFSPTVATSTPVKKAVDLIEDDDDDEKEVRANSMSSSSGNSSQKDHSPFDEEIEEEIIHEQRVPSPVAPPRSPRHSVDISSLGPLTSPVSKLNDTYIEEHSVHLSFDRSSTDIPPSTSSPKEDDTKLSNISFGTIDKNPFDDLPEHHGGTLSGRDPFGQDEIEKSAMPVASVDFREVIKQPLHHRFSSSSDEIVEAPPPIDDDEMDHAPPTTSKRYFDEIANERRYDQVPNGHSQYDTVPNNQYDQVPSFEEMSVASTSATAKQAVDLTDTSNASTRSKASSSSETESDENVTPPARRRPSATDLDRLKKETEKLREQTSAIEERIDARTHVDAVVIQGPSPFPRKEPEHSDVEEETPIDAAFQEARRNSNIEEVVISPIHDSPRLERHNSLLPARISKRSKLGSQRGKRKTRAVPEFYDTAHYPSIRLKAPSSKKKNFTILRVEQTDVWVELLNGQQVEVACRSDAIARDVFSLVVQHMNLNEHIFFGLSIVRDGEHFFLEDHQRLEKFAPPGWKSANRASQRQQYTLYLRFRFYPQILDFIRTEVTMHELFLQVRRDVLDDRIQPRRDAAFELAGLALQAEFGNRPPPAVVEYFDNHHYLPRRLCTNEDPKRLKTVLADLHGSHHGMKSSGAEHKYIQICQRQGDFGAHLHRVYRSKPNSTLGASPLDPDTGAALWIAIMPRGISVYEEQAGVREQLAEHLWPDTQTLQFDRKKFVIVAQRDDSRSEAVFYTDHHSKSSYFVKFSASQHRFMMKMRQWKNSLSHENTMQAMPDVAIEGRAPPHPVRAVSPTPLEDAPQLFEKVAPRPVAATRPQQPPPPPVENSASPRQPAQVLDVSVTSHDRSVHPDPDETVSNSLLERFEAASDGVTEDGSIRFEVALQKESHTGLGLTLVDGNLNGVKGVYVKAVAENGAGMRAGLLVGDRLLAVDGTSLEGGDRHKAVNLVKACGSVVRLEIGRMDSVVRHERSTSRDNGTSDVLTKPSSSLAPNSVPKGVSRTPPAPRRAANRRVRAVSDFGAIGDTLPALDGDRNIDLKAISGLHLDDSDEERGEYRLPQSSMYAFEHDDLELESPTRKKEPQQREASPRIPRGIDVKKKHRYARRSNAADGIEEVGEEQRSTDSSGEVIYVTLNRSAVGSIGVQIAKVGESLVIQELHSEPAISHPDLRVGMPLLSVNGEDTHGRTQQEVVHMMRSGQQVVLGLAKGQPTGNRLTVELKNPPTGTLGLSLAKRMGIDGVFIRMIAEGSAAAAEGSLRVGDRLIALDGSPIEGLTPAAILERIKASSTPVQLTVSRSE